MFLLFIFILICCIYLWRRNVLFKRRIRDLPPLYPGLWPILGHCQLLISKGDESYFWTLLKDGSDIITKNGGIMTACFGESLYFLVTDPSYAAKIANEVSNKDFMYDFLKPWLGEGLVTGNGEVWKRHRKLLNPAFSQQVLNSFIDTFNVQSRQLVKDLAVEVGKTSFNHMHYMETISLETVYHTAIGTTYEKYNIKNKNTYVDNVKEFSNIAVTRLRHFWLHNEFLYKWTTYKKRQDISVKVMKEVFIDIMKTKKIVTETNESPSEYMAFMDLLFQYSTDGSLNCEEIWDEVNTLFIASYETSASALSYILLLLGSHRGIQDKVYEELKEIFGNSYRDVHKIDLMKLVYLEAVIKESLRIYTIIPGIIRCLSQDVKLDKYTLPAGSGCVFSLHGLHRHPVWGADVDQFRPERWLESPAPPRNAFAGFGLGKRNCIGKTYAIMFLKTVLVHILRRYRITADASKLKLKLEIVIRPLSGCVISIDKRTP